MKKKLQLIVLILLVYIICKYPNEVASALESVYYWLYNAVATLIRQPDKFQG